MQGLTRKQAEIVAFIRRHQQETGYPPTRSEIAAEMGYRSPNAAEDHLRALEKKGVLSIVRNASRGIRLHEETPEGIPIVGQVAAGSPILAAECIEDYCAIPPELFRPQADYLLRVRGSSMINAGILDGDLLAVHKTSQVRDGDIVVARVDDEVTVKRLKRGRSAHRVELLAENSDFAPIVLDLREQSLVIEGISVGVIRRNT